SQACVENPVEIGRGALISCHKIKSYSSLHRIWSPRLLVEKPPRKCPKTPEIYTFFIIENARAQYLRGFQLTTWAIMPEWRAFGSEPRDSVTKSGGRSSIRRGCPKKNFYSITPAA